jgi:hypothetical protein
MSCAIGSKVILRSLRRLTHGTAAETMSGDTSTMLT